MEYLPTNPNDKEMGEEDKVEKKLKNFREYLVDKGIALAFVKGNLKITSSS